MHYELFNIGKFHVYSYGAMIAIGIIAAFIVAQKRAPKYGLSADSVFNLGVFAGVGGIIGAKLMYYITEIGAIIKDPKLLLDISNGFVVYGGIIGGILVGFIYCKVKKLKFLPYFDLVMPSIALAQGFGRIGCFLAGCCYGKETDSIIGITFTNSPFAPNNVKLLPTQLFSATGDFILFFILIIIAKRVYKNAGQIGGYYVLFYSVGRFIIEMFRNDDRGTVGSLSTSQFISCILFVLGISIVMITRAKSNASVENMETVNAEAVNEDNDMNEDKDKDKDKDVDEVEDVNEIENKDDNEREE